MKVTAVSVQDGQRRARAKGGWGGERCRAERDSGKQMDGAKIRRGAETRRQQDGGEINTVIITTILKNIQILKKKVERQR